MDIMNNRKAIMFSLMSVLFSILFITLFSQNFSTVLEDRAQGSNVRIKVMDNYAKNFETYVGESMELSAYKALDAITEYQMDRGEFYNNFTEFRDAFYNCMMCGYVDCSDRTVANNCSLEGYDLTSRVDTIIDLSNQQLNIKTVYSINSINISQTQPFDIDVTAEIYYGITDVSSEEFYASWSKNNTITREISIIGLLDPLGNINEAGGTSYSRRILRYNGICANNQSCWNYINTVQFYNEKSFRHYQNSTSFLQRYWNDSANSNIGIETILHPDELDTVNMGYSYIDQHYWIGEYSCTSGDPIFNVTLGGDEVHVDVEALIRYNLANNISTVYCNP